MKHAAFTLPLHLAAALALLGSSAETLAFGDVGALPACNSFTTCSAAVGGRATWSVRNEVTNIEIGFIMPPDLAPGVTVNQRSGSVATTAPLDFSNFCPSLPCALPEFYRAAGAKSQSDFAINRVQTLMNHSVAGILTRGNGTASVSLRTYAESASAWRDVLSFSSNGSLRGGRDRWPLEPGACRVFQLCIRLTAHQHLRRLVLRPARLGRHQPVDIRRL